MMQRLYARLLPIEFGRIDNGICLGLTGLLVSRELIHDAGAAEEIGRTLSYSISMGASIWAGESVAYGVEHG